MNDCFKHKPPGTSWIGSELFVSFDCEIKPVVEEIVITGIKQFGFIFSHEYDIKAYIEDSRQFKCEKEKCNLAVAYKFDVRFNVYEKIGIGFGLGAGTGTFGWTTGSISYIEQFKTRCICCDEGDISRERRRVIEERWRLPINLYPRAETGLSAVAAFSALGTALAISLVYPEHVLSKSFLSFVGLSATTSLAMSIHNYLKFRNKRKYREYHQ